MNRTTFVAKVPRCIGSVLSLALVSALVSACQTPPPSSPDAWTPPSEAGVDMGPHDAYMPPRSCSATGENGAHCRAGACAAPGAMCLNVPAATIQMAFGLSQAGDPDPDHAGYALPRSPSVPADDAPFNAASGGICAQRCDPAVADTCGACASCSMDMTQAPLVAAFGGTQSVLGAGLPGLCRIDCTWSATAASNECPDDMACEPFGAVCIEACTNDNECNTGFATAYDGAVLTQLDTAHPRRCDATTHRCESTPTTTAHVGDTCVADDQCPAGGVCLNGGHCAVFGCTNPNTATSTCDSNRGICLTTSQTTHPTALCLMGCNTAADCGHGNICNQLLDASNNPVMIGTFGGYCIGQCQSDEQCIASEACTDGVASDGSATAGRCVPRCTGVGLIGAASGGCMDTEQCVADHAGATYGHCAPADDFCGAPGTNGLHAASTDCATGWVCDEFLAGVAGQPDFFGDGHCTHACTSDGDCTIAGTTCVTSGDYAGLCRHACTATTDCAANQMCTSNWCVEH